MSDSAPERAFPRFRQEYFIRQSLKELATYSLAFNQRIVGAFANLSAEADNVQNEEYERLNSSYSGWEEDDSRISEAAYHKGVDYYLATAAIRQGVVNLMVAGLFHLFEQHAITVTREVCYPSRPPSTDKPFDGLKQCIRTLGIEASALPSYNKLDELRLLANVVKHGDGGSASKLRTLRPDLFEESSLPLRPLIGDGVKLTENHFTEYKTVVESFWREVANALAPLLS